MPRRRKKVVRRKAAIRRKIVAVPAVVPEPIVEQGTGNPYLVALSVILAILAFQFVPQYRVSSGWAWTPPGLLAWALALAAVAAAWLGFGNKQPSPAPADVSRGVAWSCLGVLLLIGLKMRLMGIGSPIYFFWDEMAESTYITRTFSELGGWRSFYPGDQSPFFHFWGAWVWAYFPKLTGLEVQRIAATLMDLLTVWLMYLLGKEVAGRRGGLVTAALGAVSRPMIAECFLGLQAITVPFAVALALLASFRLVKKPTLKRSILWAFSLTIMTYSYAGVRPLLTFFFLLPWVVFHFKPSAVSSGGAWRGITWLVAGLWIFLFSVFSHFLTVAPQTQTFFQDPMFSVALGLGAVLAFLLLSFGPAKNQGHPWIAWLGGAFLTLALVLPYWSNAYWARNYSNVYFFNSAGVLPKDLLMVFSSRCMGTLNCLFFGGGEYWDSIFEWTVAAATLVALGALIARRDRLQIAFLVVTLFAAATYMVTLNLHNARALSMVVPFLAFIGVAFTRAWEDSASRPSAKWIAPLVLVLLTAWTAVGNAAWLKESWMGRETIHGLVARRVLATPPGRRVYLSTQAGTSMPVQSVLCEGHDLLLLSDENTVTLGPGETAPDLTILLSPNEVKLQESLKRAYPNASWFAHPLKQDSNSAGPALLEAVIPGPLWADHHRGLFRAEKVEGRWRRKMYDMAYGFGHGLLKTNGVVSTWNEGTSNEWSSHVIRLNGVFAAPQDGVYRFSSATSCRVRLTVAGHMISDSGPQSESLKRTGALKLKAGESPIEVLVFLYGVTAIPSVTVEGPGLPAGYVLGN